MRHWDNEDEPWIEHARFQPKCEYVLVVQGPEFVRIVAAAAAESGLDNESWPVLVSTSEFFNTKRRNKKCLMDYAVYSGTTRTLYKSFQSA